MVWIVELGGDLHSLRVLEECSRENPGVIASNGGYQLAPSLLADVEDFQRAQVVSGREVDLLNGYLRIFFPERGRIAVDHISRQLPNGSKMHFVSIVDSISVSGSIGGFSFGEEGAGPVKIGTAIELQRWRDVAGSDESVQDVLAYMKGSLNDWSNLGRIVEAVEHDLGGRDGVIAKGWADPDVLKSFNATANNPRAAGVTARHGARKFDLPRKPMSIHEARAMVLKLVKSWICEKAVNPS